MQSLILPPPIEAYFAQNMSAEATAALFTEDATVWDNGEELELKGARAIREWLSRTSDEYKLTSEVRSVEEKDGEVVVGVVVSGEFPGSPYEFAYRFTLDGGQIRALAIDPIGSLA